MRSRINGIMTRTFDDVHFNPAKHGWVPRVGDWRCSSFHRFVPLGPYAPEWAARADIREWGLE